MRLSASASALRKWIMRWKHTHARGTFGVMSEGFSQEAHDKPESGEALVSPRNESFRSVCEALRDRLRVLEEAFDAYPMVTFPNGEARAPETEREQVVAKIQRLKEAIDGLLEQNEGTGGALEAYTEQALRLSREGVEHLEGFLAVQADLVNMAKRKSNDGALELANVLDAVAHTLITFDPKVPTDEAVR